MKKEADISIKIAMAQNEIFTAGRLFENYCRTLELSETSLREYKRIIDVGSGLAGFVGTCNERGVNCIGIDPRYENVERLKKDFLEQKISIRHKEFLERELNISIEEYKKERIVAFENHYARFKNKFVSGNLFSLQYTDNSFDLATCLELIATKQYFNAEKFMQGLLEMLRISKEIRVSSGHFNEDIFELDEFQQIQKNFKVKRRNKLLTISR